VLAGTTATFAVRADGGTQPYKYQWLRNGVNINGATAASYSFTAQTGDNGARFSVRVSDSAVPSSAATSSAATLTVAAAPPAERMVNGSFELSETGWAGNTGVISSWVTTGRVPYDGRFFAYLGGNGWASKETLTQTVAIPASAISARLSFALHVDTNEFTRYIAYDKLVVSVKNQAGLVLGTLATYSNLDAATGYQIRAFDLLPYKGQTVTLSFAESEDYSFQTSFTLDKVSLVTQ
jgi:hypothetical protein